MGWWGEGMDEMMRDERRKIRGDGYGGLNQDQEGFRYISFLLACLARDTPRTGRLYPRSR